MTPALALVGAGLLLCGAAVLLVIVALDLAGSRE